MKKRKYSSLREAVTKQWGLVLDKRNPRPHEASILDVLLGKETSEKKKKS